MGRRLGSGEAGPHAMVAEVSADLMRRSGSRMALQSGPKLRQGFRRQPVTGHSLPPGRGHNSGQGGPLQCRERCSSETSVPVIPSIGEMAVWTLRKALGREPLFHSIPSAWYACPPPTHP